jgi:hypothetical protein
LIVSACQEADKIQDSKKGGLIVSRTRGKIPSFRGQQNVPEQFHQKAVVRSGFRDTSAQPSQESVHAIATEDATGLDEHHPVRF